MEFKYAGRRFLIVMAVSSVALAVFASSFEDQLVSQNIKERVAALTVLSRMPYANRAESIPGLVRYLQDSNPIIAANAEWALAYMGPSGKEAVPALIEALHDRTHFVRAGAAFALGRMGHVAQEAEPALREALKDSAPDVRTKSNEALVFITGMSPHQTNDGNRRSVITNLLFLGRTFLNQSSNKTVLMGIILLIIVLLLTWEGR